MGRLLIVFGILSILVGICGMIYAFFTPFQTAINTVVNTAISTPDATKYCNPGESIVQEFGPPSSRVGGGTGRSVYYYCVDGGGNRREVTGDVVENLLGTTVSNLSGVLGNSLLMTGLIVVGVFFLIVGSIFAGWRRAAAFSVGGQHVFIDGKPVEGEFNLTTLIEQAKQMKASSGTDTLTERLQALEKARDAHLISRDEYERLRQQILDSFHSSGGGQ